MRIQVNVGQGTVARLDRLAKEVGVTRSALCSMLIYQGLPNDFDENERDLLIEHLQEKLIDREMKKSNFKRA